MGTPSAASTRARTRHRPPQWEQTGGGAVITGAALTDDTTRHHGNGDGSAGQPIHHCPSCGNDAPRLIRSYWGPYLCPACCEAVVDQRDADGTWPTPWWEEPVPPHIIVLGPGCVWRRNKPHTIDIRSIRQLGALCERYKVTQVWIHQSALESLGLPPAIDPADPRWPDQSTHPWTDDHGDYGSGRWPGLREWAYWFRKGGAGFHLNIPAYGRSTWQGCESAAELAGRVAMFDRATGGVPWRGSPTITSDGFLRERYAKGLAPTELPPPMANNAAHEVAMVWRREARPDESGLLYCHALDLNLAYASGASSLPLPTGECVHLELPAYDSTMAGVYFIDDGAKGQWVTAPTMERLAAKGVQAIEGYVWPNSRRHLRPWYEMLRDARMALLEGGGPALDAVKDICHWGLGRLQSKKRTLGPGKTVGDDPLYQPYWAWAVIAETRERLMARVEALPIEPIAIDTDCLFFLSDLPNPAAVAVHLRLPLGDGLGQFKDAGTCLGVTARAALEAPRVDETIKALRQEVKS